MIRNIKQFIFFFLILLISFKIQGSSFEGEISDSILRPFNRLHKVTDFSLDLDHLFQNVYQVEEYSDIFVFGKHFNYSPDMISKISKCNVNFSKKYFFHNKLIKQVVRKDIDNFIDSNIFVLEVLISQLGSLQEDDLVEPVTQKNMNYVFSLIKNSEKQLTLNMAKIQSSYKAFEAYSRSKCYSVLVSKEITDYYSYLMYFFNSFSQVLDKLSNTTKDTNTFPYYLVLNLHMYYTSFKELKEDYINNIRLIGDFSFSSHFSYE